MRALIEYLPFFAFGLAFLLQNVGRVLRVTIVSLCLLFVSVNLVQSYQYQKFILHWDSMDQDRFWTVFMKTDRKYDGIFYREPHKLERPAAEQILHTAVFASDLEEGTTWGGQGINSDKASSGTRSTLINAKSQYGSTVGIPVSELGPAGEKKLLITAMIWSEAAFPNVSIAYSYRNESNDYGHDYIAIGQFVSEPQQWIKVEQIADLKSAADSTDNWIVYPINSGEGDVYLDDIRYEVITLNPASEQP